MSPYNKNTLCVFLKQISVQLITEITNGLNQFQFY